MKDSFNNIDELLRQSLEGYQKEPSAGVWKRISAQLMFNGRGLYFISAAFLIVVLSGTFIFLNLNHSEKELVVENGDISTMVAEEVSQEIKQEKSDYPIKPVENEKQKYSISDVTITQSIPENEIPGNTQKSTTNNEDTEPDAILGSTPENFITELGRPNSSDQNNNYLGLERLKNQDKPKHSELNAFSGFYLTYEFFSKINPRASCINMPTTLKDDYGRRGMWSYGVHLTPEIIFTNGSGNAKQMALNLDATGIYIMNDWFLQFGLGVGLSEDDGTYKINYAQYDSIGYYYEVTGFLINPENGQPIFNTRVEGVFDTVLYNQIETTNNSYTYLRFPVLGGIRIHENKRFSVSLKAGGIYSILISKKEPGSDFMNENATWISISNETPERIQSNFQLTVGVGLSYQLSNKLSIGAEPVYNYFVNPVYERRLNSKSPWSLGLRAGVVFQF
ncbi:MAG: hypothetical protein R2764_22645 [Bacteroidales bacterium]